LTSDRRRFSAPVEYAPANEEVEASKCGRLGDGTLSGERCLKEKQRNAR